MAKTVDNFSTIEDFRTSYNDLATDVGDKSGLRTDADATLVDAINSIEEKVFFFQEYIYTPNSNTTVFTGADAFNHTLSIRKDRIQVFHNDGAVTKHLFEGDDYSLSGYDITNNLYNTITLNATATSGDKVTIYSFTGSYLGTVSSGAGSIGYFTETTAKTIYNTNDSGVILNGVGATKTTVLQNNFDIQLDGRTYLDGHLETSAGNHIQAPILRTAVDGIVLSDTTATGFTSLTSTAFSDGTATITGGAGTGFTTLAAGTSVTSPKLIGDVYASNGSSKILENGTDGTNAVLTGKVTDITDHSIDVLSDVTNSGKTAGDVLAWSGSAWSNSAASNVWSAEDTKDAIADMITGGTHTNLTVTETGDDGGSHFLNFSAAGAGDITAVTAGVGLAGGATSGAAALSVNTSDGIKILVDDVVLDYETVSSAPGSVGSTAIGHLWFVI